jgi:hypothetical protein
MTIAQIKQTLNDQFGVAENDISYQKKADLVEKAKEIEKSHMPEETIVQDNNGVQIISVPYDEEEAQHNQQQHKQNPNRTLKPTKRRTEYDPKVYDASDEDLKSGRRSFRMRDGVPRKSE